MTVVLKISHEVLYLLNFIFCISSRIDSFQPAACAVFSCACRFMGKAFCQLCCKYVRNMLIFWINVCSTWLAAMYFKVDKARWAANISIGGTGMFSGNKVAHFKTVWIKSNFHKRLHNDIHTTPWIYSIMILNCWFFSSNVLPLFPS